MPELRGATGCNRPIECKYFRSYSGAVKILRRGFSPIAADDNGSISFWRRHDTGVLRGAFYSRLSTLDERDFANLKEMRDWLAEWYPRMS